MTGLFKGAKLTCVICGEEFIDAGMKPLTCGKRDCALEALRKGLFKKSLKNK
jgi:hypothetical protein